MQACGLYLIGDELLSGKRQDKHLAQVTRVVQDSGLHLRWVQVLGDDAAYLAAAFEHSMGAALPVFSFGGIGATPDDVTRQAAARAAGRGLEPHPGAVAEIEAQFGAEAYPNRIRMAALPSGCELIPNPVNRVPGFSLHNHYFMPGFPSMAWPMLDWVLKHHFTPGAMPVRECALRVLDAHESDLMPMMEALCAAHPQVKLFSLPSTRERRQIELGFRGEAGVEQAFADLRAALDAAQVPYVLLTPA